MLPFTSFPIIPLLKEITEMAGRISPARKHAIAEHMAVTQNVSETARQLGISKATVSRIARRDDVLPIIEQEQLKFYESLPNARANIQLLVDKMFEVDEEGLPILSEEERKWAFEASRDMLKGTGMLPSQASATYVLNLTQNNSKKVISPVILGLMQQHKQAMLGLTEELDAEEAELTNVTNTN